MVSASSCIRGAATCWRRHERSRPAQCGDAVPDTAKPDSLWHRDCHKGKTASDRVRMAKVDRLRKAHLDLKKRSEEHTSELQSLMRISYAVFCLKKNNTPITNNNNIR